MATKSLYADDLVVIADTEEDLIKRLNQWKNNVENRDMRVHMNNTKVMISGECQKPVQKAARWPCGVCGRGVGSNYRQHCAQRKSAGISFTQRQILRFFAPQGRHVAPMGVKFGTEEGTEGPPRRGPKVPSSVPNFTPICATTRV